MENLDLFGIEPQGSDWCDSRFCTTIFCAPYTYYRRCYDPLEGKVYSYCDCPSTIEHMNPDI